MLNSNLAETDTVVANAIAAEEDRQEDNLEMIASENHVSEAVLEAQGRVLTNKYAEGYPDSGYYGGCEHMDTVEQAAIDRAKQLYGAEHANVQLAVLNPDEKILSLDLNHGGISRMGTTLTSLGNSMRWNSTASTQRPDISTTTNWNQLLWSSIQT